MSHIAINSSQNVNIDFTLASVGERLAAFAIDTIIKIAYLFFLFAVVFEITGIGQYINQLEDNWSAVAIIIVLTLPVTTYTLVQESMMQGQTIGKKLMKIKVVKIDGYQASFVDYFTRWVFGLVDFYFTSALLATLSVILTKNNQRIGGIASGTSVISLKNDYSINSTILENISNEYIPKFSSVVLLSDEDVNNIKNIYEKANAVGDSEMIEKLVNRISEIININPNSIEMSNRKLIKKLLEDYNYYTAKDT